MEINRGEDLSIEEEVLRKLLNEWRNLDERFIPEDYKILCGNIPTISIQTGKRQNRDGRASRESKGQSTRPERKIKMRGKARPKKH